MPYSSPVLDKKMLKMLRDIRPATVYDIGAGAGKYGKLIKQSPSLKKIVKKIIGIEIDREYIKRFDLNSVYDEVWRMPATELMSHEFYDTNFDTIIIGDCIEHMRKTEGIDLLNFLVYRSRWILVQYPVKYLQNTVNGKYHEAHISVWSDTDFAGFDVQTKYACEWKRAVLIQGYQAE